MINLKELQAKNSSNPRKNKDITQKKGHKNPQGLDSEQKSILSDLLRMKAATLLRFKVESSSFMGKDKGHIQKKLDELVQANYVKEYPYRENDPEMIVYTPSWKTRLLKILGKL